MRILIILNITLNVICKLMSIWVWECILNSNYTIYLFIKGTSFLFLIFLLFLSEEFVALNKSIGNPIKVFSKLYNVPLIGKLILNCNMLFQFWIQSNILSYNFLYEIRNGNLNQINVLLAVCISHKYRQKFWFSFISVFRLNSEIFQ